MSSKLNPYFTIDFVRMWDCPFPNPVDDALLCLLKSKGVVSSPGRHLVPVILLCCGHGVTAFSKVDVPVNVGAVVEARVVSHCLIGMDYTRKTYRKLTFNSGQKKAC
jgi:uncharacterized metal-binding protein